MKHYFYFVRQVSGFSTDDVVYKVSVGSSVAEQAKAELVKRYAKDCGMYFERVSDQSDRTIELLANGVFTGKSFPTLYLRRANISISHLFKLIIDDSFVVYEMCLVEPPTVSKLLSLFSPSFKLSQSQSQSYYDLPCPTRKYLSQRERAEITQVGIAVSLILGLFMLSGYLEGIARATNMF